MPSEDAKNARKVEEEDDDNKSLTAIRQSRKRDTTNGGSSATKPKPKPKIEKEEPQYTDDDDDDEDEDFDDKPIIKARGKAVSSKATAATNVKKNGNADDDDDDDNKPISRKISSRGKKEESSDNEEEDNKPISRKSSASNADKSNNKKKEVKRKSAVQLNGKREKKVYDLPGQKRDPPEERESLRIFYETLYKQIPRSEMAQVWMMESGLLSKEEAKKVFEKLQIQKSRQKLTSPVKGVTATKTADNRKAPASPLFSSKKRAEPEAVDESSEDNSDDDDFLPEPKPKKQRAS